MQRALGLSLLLVACGTSSRERPADASDTRSPKVAAATAAPGATTPKPAVPTADDLARVEAILRDETRRDPSRAIQLERAEDLAPLGERALPALAHFLEGDLGDLAAETMLAIDHDRAAPLVFASMPRSDRNVQYHTFASFNRRLRDGETPCCTTEMHDAAVRCLEADTNADAAEQALLAIGLTGSAADFPLLRRWSDAPHEVPLWKGKLHAAASAALARLGDEPELARIEAELSVKVPRKLRSDDARRIAAIIEKAAFSGRDQFVPSLCRHLGDPFPKDFSDNIPPMPATEAARALAILIDHDRKAPPDIARWKLWCDSRPITY